MFIAAAIACGYKVKRQDDGPNAYLNISIHCHSKGLTQPVVAYNLPLVPGQPVLRVIEGGPQNI